MTADSEHIKFIDEIARTIIEKGPEFENNLKKNEANNPRFAFLFGGQRSQYFKWKFESLKKKSQEAAAPSAEPPKKSSILEKPPSFLIQPQNPHRTGGGILPLPAPIHQESGKYPNYYLIQPPFEQIFDYLKNSGRRRPYTPIPPQNLRVMPPKRPDDFIHRKVTDFLTSIHNPKPKSPSHSPPSSPPRTSRQRPASPLRLPHTITAPSASLESVAKDVIKSQGYSHGALASGLNAASQTAADPFEAFRLKRAATYHNRINTRLSTGVNDGVQRCYACGQPGHFARDCTSSL